MFLQFLQKVAEHIEVRKYAFKFTTLEMAILMLVYFDSLFCVPDFST